MLSLPVAAVLAALTGVLLEVVVHLATGRNEAWTASSDQRVAVALVASFGIGLLAAGRGGDVGRAPGQVAAMTIRAGEVGSLWPLAIVLSAFLSAPFVAASFAGSQLRSVTRKKN